MCKELLNNIITCTYILLDICQNVNSLFECDKINIGNNMKLIKTKLLISIFLLIIMSFFIIFLTKYLYLVADFIMVIIFLLFTLDSLTVLIPSLNYDQYTKLHMAKYYIEKPNYNNSILLNKKENQTAKP